MSIFFFFFLALSLLFQFQFQFQVSQSATVVVDGVSQWRNPQVQVGDSVIFQHKNQYNLYIFQTQNAFNLCNFSQATLLKKPNSKSYTWHTSRPGFFYFSFNNGSNKACLDGQKLAVKVTVTLPPDSSPELASPTAAPPLSSGGVVASSPAFSWPFQPRESPSPSASPSPSPSTVELPGGGAAGPTAQEREGIPFINSNPAVPLPTGEVDSATIRPSPTNGDHATQVMGFLRRALSLTCLTLAMIL